MRAELRIWFKACPSSWSVIGSVATSAVGYYGGMRAGSKIRIDFISEQDLELNENFFQNLDFITFIVRVLHCSDIISFRQDWRVLFPFSAPV